MQEQAAQIQAEALAAIEAATTEAALEDARVKFLGKKSPLNALAAGMRDLSPEEKPKLGAALNAARQAIGGALETQKQSLQDAADAASVADLDPSLPARIFVLSHLLLSAYRRVGARTGRREAVSFHTETKRAGEEEWDAMC